METEAPGVTSDPALRAIELVGPLRVSQVPIYETVAHRLRRAVHLGAFLPGDMLPPERLLAETMGVSRVTIREAIRVLQAEGYFEARSGARGGLVFVDSTESTEVLRARLRQRREELESIFEFREANECAAARLAAARRTDRDLDRADAAIEEMTRAEHIAPFRRADSAFHLAIADAARNPLLRDAVEDARAAMFLPLDAIDLTVTKATSVPQHREILAAIRAGNSTQAAELMAAHVQLTAEEMRAILDGPPS
jgi:GntR family transcriptional regulator, transcriptional repressor for pyruvate dehydrogenase complex